MGSTSWVRLGGIGVPRQQATAPRLLCPQHLALHWYSLNSPWRVRGQAGGQEAVVPRQKQARVFSVVFKDILGVELRECCKSRGKSTLTPVTALAEESCSGPGSINCLLIENVCVYQWASATMLSFPQASPHPANQVILLLQPLILESMKH